MSWMKENYEKAALGGAVVVALGIGALAMSGGKDLDKNAQRGGAGSAEFEIPGDKVLSASTSKSVEEFLLEDRKLDDGRELRAFVSMPLYMRKGGNSVLGLSPDEEIHPGIKNKWWFDHGLDDYQWADGPSRDADDDGFTNGEEHEGGTNPTDKADRPELLSKLHLSDLTFLKLSIRWNELGADKIGIDFSSKKDGGTIFSPSAGFKVGDLFPASGAYKEKFKLIEKKRGVPPGGQFEVTGYTVEDTRNKKRYDVWESQKTEIREWTGKFKLNTPDGTEFQLEEGESFSLPFNKDAEEKPYLFKKQIDGDKAEIRKGDQTKVVPKK